MASGLLPLLQDLAPVPEASAASNPVVKRRGLTTGGRRVQ